MHLALAIPELCSTIADNCTSSPSDLLSLALTRRGFTESCINALYRSATIDLFDLVKLLPFAKPQPIGISGIHCTKFVYFQLHSELISLDHCAWERFNYFAQKTAHLHISFEKFSNEFFSIFLVWCQVQHSGRTVLFPRLQALTVADLITHQSVERPYTAILMPFLAERLRRLSIQIDYPIYHDRSLRELQTLSSILPDVCPNLQTIGFLLYRNTTLQLLDETILLDDCLAYVAKLITSGQHVTSLEIDINDLDMEKFLKMPLHRLTNLNLTADEVDIPYPGTTYEPCLPSLQILDVHLDAETLSFVLESLDTPKLIEARIKTWNPFTNDESSVGTENDDGSDASNESYLPDPTYETRSMQRITSALALHTQISFLERFLIKFTCLNTIQLSALSPLFTFRNLRELELKIDSLEIYDTDIVKLAKSFPLLKSLSLPDAPGATLASLTSFSIYTTQLVALTIRIDASKFPPKNVLKTIKLKSSVFRRLTVHDSNILSPSRVAKFLLLVFPSIAAVEISPETTHCIAKGRKDLWTCVKNHIVNPSS